MPTNNEDLTRVGSHIQGAITSFCKTRFQTNPMFFMADLVRYVSSYPGIKVAPNSPARVFQQMKRDGKLDYMVVNRSKSFYKVTKVS